MSPAYLAAARGNASNTTWTTTRDITVTPAFQGSTGFYFVRHAKYNTHESTNYKLRIPTSAFGNITVPQLNDTTLTLNGRDSKIHVSDYDIGGATLVYSTAEVFTWQKYEDKTVLVLYGGPGETHELVLAVTGYETLEGEVRTIATRGYTLINWKATEQRKLVKVGVDKFIYVYLLGEYLHISHILGRPDMLQTATRLITIGLLIKALMTPRTQSFCERVT